MPQLRRFVPFVLALFLLAAGSSLRADTIAEARDALYASYSEKLAELAARCEKENQPALAEKLQAWLPKCELATSYLFDLPSSTSDAPKPDVKLSPLEAEFRKLRDAQADSLFELANRAIKEAQPSLAYELVPEVVRENPDHKQACKLLGYVRFRDGWHTPYEVRQFQFGKVWDPKFGWLPKAHVARYAKGERFDGKHWISAEEDVRLHPDIDHAWHLE